MKYRITHTTKYTYSEPASVCQNKVHLAPRATPNQRVEKFRLVIGPEPNAASTTTDYFGNRVDYFSIPKPHRGLSVTATSTLEVVEVERPISLDAAPAWESVAQGLKTKRTAESLEAFQFAFSSQLASVDPRYAAFALESFAPGRPIVDACRDLTRRVYEQFKYDPRATTVSTPVSDVFERKAGVCQDFAHLQIACLRSIGMAARYVSGYLRTIPPEGKPRLVGADASHAWLGVYCGEALGWVDFDPTNNLIPCTDHVVLGWGRDYSDLCPIQGVFVGGGQNVMEVSVDVMPKL